MKKKILIPIIAIIVLALVLGAFFLKPDEKRSQYQEATNYADSFLYEFAREKFLALGDYEDSAEQARRIEQLTADTKAAMPALCPGDVPQYDWSAHYWCESLRIELGISWAINKGGTDGYAVWYTNNDLYTDFEAQYQLLGTTWKGNRVIRYDASSGEYIFAQYAGDELFFESSLPMAEQVRGRMNPDGTLTILDGEGTEYLFKPRTKIVYPHPDIPTYPDTVIVDPVMDQQIKDAYAEADFENYRKCAFNVISVGSGILIYELLNDELCRITIEGEDIRGEAPFTWENGILTIDLNEWKKGDLTMTFTSTGKDEYFENFDVYIQCDALNIKQTVQVSALLKLSENVP